MSVGPLAVWTEGAKRVLALAQEEAARLRHTYVGTEHLLLGLLRSDSPAVKQALVPFGLSIERAREQILAISPPDAVTPSNGDTAPLEFPLTPRTKTIVTLAETEATLSGATSVEAEHVLLALVREGGGVGAQLLASLGATAERVRRGLRRPPRGG